MADDKATDSNKEVKQIRNDSVGEQEEEERAHSPDPYFEPLVKLPLMEVKTLEEDEEVLLCLRGKLYRYDNSQKPAEWKERGTGEVKILRNSEGYCRILMRRDKTFKICANHYVHYGMELKPSCGSDRAWVWSTPADFADEEPKPELLALRLANAENAQKFKEKFEEAKKLTVLNKDKEAGDTEAVPLAEKLDALAIKEEDEEVPKNAETAKE